MMWFFEYRVIFYDDGNNYKKETKKGMVVGKNFKEASERIYAWYGDENLDQMELAYIEGPEDGIWEF